MLGFGHFKYVFFYSIFLPLYAGLLGIGGNILMCWSVEIRDFC